MATEVNYNIILKNETEGTRTPVATQESASQGGAVGTPAGKSIAKQAERQGTESINASLITFQTIKPFVSQMANNASGELSMYSGAVELQQRTNAAIAISGQVTGVVTAGIAGGPIGMALALSALAVSNAYAERNLALKNQIEQENTNIKASRFKLATDRSRR